jgi:hypothetical protein
MKSALAGFLVTALLLALHVAPPPEAFESYASPTDRDFARRHDNESEAELRSELGLDTK